MARIQVTRRYYRVALVIETTRAYGRRIIEGVLRYVKEHDPWLIEMEPRALPDSLSSSLKGWKGDGIIARVADSNSVRALNRLGIPVVYLKSETQLQVGHAAPVLTDQPAIGRAAADHFHERGYRCFGFVGAPGLSWSDKRLLGFRQRIGEFKGILDVYEREKHKKWSIEGLPGPSASEVAAWVKSLPRPVGILAADDFIGLKLLNACKQHGIAVPDEVAVIGVDDEESICRFTVPTLSSIIPDNARMGYEAASRLDRMMRGKSIDKDGPVLIPPLGVSVRQSSDTIAIEDEFVSRAMTFIRERACLGITINDVAKHVHLAPSTLQRRFTAALHRPVYESILRVKIDFVRALLADTDLTLKEIAHRAGFEHIEHLATLFKKRVGKTLQEYRRVREFFNE